MVNTCNFKTKTIISERQNPIRDRWNIGLDIGYSGVKGFVPNSVFCFPAFAKRVEDGRTSIAKPKASDIQYKNLKTGEIWDVGESANDLCSSNDSELAVFGRARYFSPMFKVLSETGMALGMLENKFGSPEGKEIFLQTGLPPDYLAADEPFLKESLAGTHDFAVKIGTSDWLEYHFTLEESKIGVIEQPKGTLLSVAVASNGNPSAGARKYFSSKLLIMDVGFGTMDIYNIANGKVATKPETIDDLSMKQVFKQTIHDIFEKYHKEITITGLQNYLQDGKIPVMNRKERKSAKVPFDDILEKNSKDVCLRALERICNTYDNLLEHEFLIITGGTCAAWSNYIRDFFSGMETLTILSGAQNDDLSAIFSNVRGYYMFAYNNN